MTTMKPIINTQFILVGIIVAMLLSFAAVQVKLTAAANNRRSPSSSSPRNEDNNHAGNPELLQILEAGLALIAEDGHGSFSNADDDNQQDDPNNSAANEQHHDPMNNAAANEQQHYGQEDDEGLNQQMQRLQLRDPTDDDDEGRVVSLEPHVLPAQDGDDNAAAGTTQQQSQPQEGENTSRMRSAAQCRKLHHANMLSDALSASHTSLLVTAFSGIYRRCYGWCRRPGT